MKTKVLKGFYDRLENVWHGVGDEVEVTEERFEEIRNKLPDYIEEVSDKKLKSKPKKDEVVNDELPI